MDSKVPNLSLGLEEPAHENGAVRAKVGSLAGARRGIVAGGICATKPTMTPEHGGKIELKLRASGADGADYDAFLQTASTVYRGRARVEGRQVTFEWQADVAEAPPEWLLADARAALKTALRTSQAEGRFPRRITRWRPEPSE